MSTHTFTPGQAVTVRRGYPCKWRELRTVKRVLKRFVELDDGSKWETAYGHGPYPRQRGYHPPSIAPTTGADHAWIARQVAIEALERARGRHGEWAESTDEQLIAAAQALSRARTEQKSEHDRCRIAAAFCVGGE